MGSEEMYRENILDHYKSPRNRGKLDGATSRATGNNPFCGDVVSFSLKIGKKSGVLEDVKFEGMACAICLASASMLTEEVKGKPLEYARGFEKDKLLGIIGINPGPTRLKCALLPLKVLKLAVYKYLGKKMGEEDENLV
jgi:nitrogen fixation protein NifU and related proteins